MKSVIICEGGTDLTLVQYFMEVAHGWEHIKQADQRNHLAIDQLRNVNMVKWMIKDNDYLAIVSAGGATKIPDKFNSFIEYNTIIAGPTDTIYDNIVIITDRDEVESEQEFTTQIQDILQDNNIKSVTPVENNSWRAFKYVNLSGDKESIKILLLVIPFQDTGALETFLLTAISKTNTTEEKVVKQCNHFVDDLDTDGKHLKHRRHVTKAKFDVYFSVRTPIEQFVERRNILRDVPWEEFEEIQTSFKKLKDLHS